MRPASVTVLSFLLNVKIFRRILIYLNKNQPINNTLDKIRQTTDQQKEQTKTIISNIFIQNLNKIKNNNKLL